MRMNKHVKPKNTVVGCHSLLQGIFPTQGSNPDCRQILYCLSHQGSLSLFIFNLQIRSDQLLSHVRLFATP